MINVYLVSGFLGSGKTTFIQKLLKEKKFEKVMILENEFGEVGVDGAFFDSSLKVKEINNGCICCSLQGDFEEALEEIEEYGISDLIVEPSGVGKLSEIIKVIAKDDDFRIVSHICIVDVKTCIKYHKNFKEYFDDQVSSANALILSHLDVASEDDKNNAIKMLEEINDDAIITTKPINEYSIEELLNIIVKGGEIIADFDDEEDGCCCHHHHHDDEECCCHHEHHHEHHHDGECHHHHHDDDDDDEIFKNIIFRPERLYSKEELENMLSKMPEELIRVKGWVNSNDGTLYFNYVLNEYHVFVGEKRNDTLISFIGTEIDEDYLKEVFHA